jgi:hypothetical protein
VRLQSAPTYKEVDFSMTHDSKHSGQPSPPWHYQIRLQGHLDPAWAVRFPHFAITLAANGESLLTGTVADQAALHGVLRTVRDLGLPLLEVRCLHEVTSSDTISSDTASNSYQ